MFTAAYDSNSLPSVVGFSSHLVLLPTVCGCPQFGCLRCSRIISEEKTLPKGPVWEHGFTLLFPECPLKAGGHGRAWEVPSLTACWGKGSSRWEHLFAWVTGGKARETWRNRQIYSWIKASQRSFLPSPEHIWIELTGLWWGFPPSCQSGLSFQEYEIWLTKDFADTAQGYMYQEWLQVGKAAVQWYI